MVFKTYQLKDSEVTNLLKGIRIADCMTAVDDSSAAIEDNISNIKELSVSNVMTCSYCNVTFSDATDQRCHFKLDWHRYNLKQALAGLKFVTEECFQNLADDVSSISGSDDDTSSESDSEINDLPDQSTKEDMNPCKTIRHAKIFFENDEGQLLSLYKCLLQSKKETPRQDQLIDAVTHLHENINKWLIILLGGGHFAAAAFENGIVTNHKTFHCYTVRAKQGGGQSARDNRGGNHPKSAGASLRRYNEQALVQHVQEVISSWTELIKSCQLIFYRAPGPYNRGVLFGGKNPPLQKFDNRLRSIPFPTRRATFKETKRVYDVLSLIEFHGDASQFRNCFPRSPSKSSSRTGISNQSTEDNLLEKAKGEEGKNVKKKIKIHRSKERALPDRELPDSNFIKKSDSNSSSGNEDLVLNDMTISFNDLQEYADTVPQRVKDAKNLGNKRKHKKPSNKQKGKLEKKIVNNEIENIRRKLASSCTLGDEKLLSETLKISNNLPQRINEESVLPSENKMTKEDFLECINSVINEETRDTALHVCASKCFPRLVTMLLEAGADPTIKNRQKLTPYVTAGNKETRNSFKSFVASFPVNFDFKLAKIPEPISEEKEKELEEKKKEKKRNKKEKDKIKKKETQEKKVEEKEKERFLALSDREKCAIAAERRILQSATANIRNAKPIVLSRCFQCGLDISGKVPFEYGTNRFCTIPCLKAHRLKTNSFGMEI